jgi:hypothetical protein
MAEPADDDEFRSHWFTFPVELFLHDNAPDGPPLAIELRPASEGTSQPASRAADRPAVVEVSGGEVRTRLGSAASPDLILAGSPRLILGLLGAYLTPADAEALGLAITGDPAILRRVQPQPADPAAAGQDRPGQARPQQASA